MNKTVLVLFVIFAFLLAPMRPARAATVGDAILTVGISTAAGAVLGLSTLPFYHESSEHVRNIFYGAAVGAVAGVLITAYSGFQDTADSAYDDADLRKFNQYDLAKTAKAVEWKEPNRPDSFSNVLVYSNLYGTRF